MNQPINVDILYDENDITFMFSKKEFCKMMSLSQKKYNTIITDISDNTQYKRGRFRVLKEENWNNIMRDALDILEHASDKSLSDALQEYIDTHKQDIPDYEWLFGYCDIPALIYLSYCNTKKITLSQI